MLHYQPIVSLADGSVSHYEALLRLAEEPVGATLIGTRDASCRPPSATG